MQVKVVWTICWLIEGRRGLRTGFLTTALSLGATESAAQTELLGHGQEPRGQCQGMREAEELVNSWGWAVTCSQAQLTQVLGDTLASGMATSVPLESGELPG